MPAKRIAILGTVGVPANYGGFETLAENLVRYHHAHAMQNALTVYCSSRSYPARESSFLSARLRFIPLSANGAQSILYDTFSLFSAVWHRSDVILLLGVSGATALPLVRFFSSARIITNIDGIEWRREKWRGLAKRFLRFSEKIAIRFSHEVIADNVVIATYAKKTYGLNCHVIAYGGDHALTASPVSVSEYILPQHYAFAICRIEPENNVHMILEAFAMSPGQNLVMVGNWTNSGYGRELKHRFANHANLYLLNPVYDLGKLHTLRTHAQFYVHGHSAGGTNPSLVEAMHFSLPVLAFDCDFNRSTTEDHALFFKDTFNLVALLNSLDTALLARVASKMKEIANRRYTWSIVAQQYFALLSHNSPVFSSG